MSHTIKHFLHNLPEKKTQSMVLKKNAWSKNKTRKIAWGLATFLQIYITWRLFEELSLKIVWLIYGHTGEN
jgi:hypothetical protein